MGYDSGGWIYRDLGGQRQLQPGTRWSPAAPSRRRRWPARYGGVRAGNGQMYKYGFDVNARGATQLAEPRRR